MKTTTLRVAIATLALVATSCSKSAPQSLCDTICDCEHCGTQAEELACASAEADLRVATDYGCEAQWNAWADCVQGQGVCVDAKATFSTKLPGHCTKLYDIGLPCTATTDCTPLGVSSATCIAGKCQTRQCEENGQICSADTDCPTTGDKCSTQAADLATCEAKASGHPGAVTTSGTSQSPSPASPGGG